MADQEVIKLLEEIRDLQKLHVENYKEALANQQQSVAMQKMAVRRSKSSLLFLYIFLGVFFAFMVWSTFWR